MVERPSANTYQALLKHLDLWKDPRQPPESLELVCEPFHSRISVPWQDDVPEIDVG